jgi:hypothetical protein
MEFPCRGRYNEAMVGDERGFLALCVAAGWFHAEPLFTPGSQIGR